ncbi:hypothetical protein GCK72_012032 [Caenorhabditis remanei]|uniref:Homeobox domain-containing protein n=1 Tax=Caenorhabditis remanei TaxID=31234 RepID=A0A6A5GM54_CAERE|nr:hypothetical protein GCK72_012032 [Caenorhabditis remanei]KAF1755582.1 hypothetical protein GCK72_012032 [Caenorhabditis remanei]
MAEATENPSVSEPVKPELWKTVTEPSKVIETYYSEGNFYHDVHIEELATLANTSHKNVRDTLSRLRKKDEKAGKFVPAAPRQQYEFSDEQRKMLEDAFNGEFDYGNKMSTEATRALAMEAKLTVKQVNNWFCNQRRKRDGRSAEKDKKRREKMKLERLSKGLGRPNIFSAEDLQMFSQYYIAAGMAAMNGQKFKVPYGELAEKTQIDRKKIRDWFSKKKAKENKLKNMDNVENEEDEGEESDESVKEEDCSNASYTSSNNDTEMAEVDEQAEEQEKQEEEVKEEEDTEEKPAEPEQPQSSAASAPAPDSNNVSRSLKEILETLFVKP